MIYHMTNEVLRQHIEDFFKSTMQQDEYDAEDVCMLEQCILDTEFCKNMAGNANPYYRDLVLEFKKWLVPVVRRNKIQDLLYLNILF